ncbi:putative Multidrug efflux transporter, membrane fusion protein [Candidatus Moduliflexus flocculans]|uniref:Putative Multidrug efflux transporter, membrane fusion protein n=1 Tax=Candidatus Moduliflexus flocculans TaxID=1499966 RepID=A0A081BMK8_9BACT|nr:putative Multidrug efflux transporter, membrane fusion protein [Candidatus Moduliflexus flocculans]
MRKQDVIMIVNIFALVSLAFAQYGCSRPERSEAQASIPQEKTISVMVYETRPETISRYLKLTGGIEAGNETLVYSQTTEKLEQVNVKVGEQVSANQVLAVQSGRTQQQSVKQAKAAVENAKAQEELARQNHARNEQLFREKIISKQQFDQTDTALKSAILTVEQAEAQLAQSQEQQGNTVIKAPFAGKIAQIFFNKGDMVSSGQAVFKIVNTGTYKAKLNVPETDAAHISLGQSVFATFPSIPDVEFVGSITRIDEAIDTSTRALEVEVSFVNTAEESSQTSSSGALSSLRSGQFGQFKLEIQRHADAIAIPDNALMTQTEVKLNDRGEQTTLKTYYVYVAEQGKAVMKTVTPGIYSSGRVELTSGVNIGDAIIVIGQNIVKNGDTIAIANQQARVE